MRLKALKYRFDGHPGVGSPTTLVNIPTELFTHRIVTSWLDEPFPKTLTIRGGDWDLKSKPFEECSNYQYIKNYHKSGRNSDKSKTTSEWNVSENHLIEFEELYKSIRKEGYKTQDEIYKNGDILNEVNVCIGRDGKVIVKHGYHRVSIAKVLGLDFVPVYVRVRHENWQHIRDEAWKADSVEQLSPETCRHLSHPDIYYAFEY